MNFSSYPKVFRHSFMSEQQRRHISTLADGETGSASVSTTLSMLASNEHLIGVWERYHLIGSALRSEPVHSEYRPIWTRVREWVTAEPAVSPLDVGSTPRPGLPTLSPGCCHLGGQSRLCRSLCRASALRAPAQRRDHPEASGLHLDAGVIPPCRVRQALVGRGAGLGEQAGPISRQSSGPSAGIPYDRFHHPRFGVLPYATLLAMRRVTNGDL